jgi:hypothetical protein
MLTPLALRVISNSPQTLGPPGLRLSYPRGALLGARNARVTLEAGFTTVRNVGGYRATRRHSRGRRTGPAHARLGATDLADRGSFG